MLKFWNATYTVPVRWSTTGVENWFSSQALPSWSPCWVLQNGALPEISCIGVQCRPWSSEYEIMIGESIDSVPVGPESNLVHVTYNRSGLTCPWSVNGASGTPG